jgi:hypothetical protein
MGPALAHNGADNGGVATRAWQPCTTEDVKFVRIASAMPRYTIEIGFARPQRCATVVDPALENGANGVMEPFDFTCAQGVGHPFRMNFGLPQGLIHIDVPESCHTGLIQELGFDGAGFPFELRLQGLNGKGVFKRLRT